MFFSIVLLLRMGFQGSFYRLMITKHFDDIVGTALDLGSYVRRLVRTGVSVGIPSQGIGRSDSTR